MCSASSKDKEGRFGVDSSDSGNQWDSWAIWGRGSETYANILSYSSSEISVMAFLRTMPTVLMTMSILPKSSSVSANSLSTAT